MADLPIIQPFGLSNECLKCERCERELCWVTKSCEKGLKELGGLHKGQLRVFGKKP